MFRTVPVARIAKQAFENAVEKKNVKIEKREYRLMTEIADNHRDSEYNQMQFDRI